MTTHRRLIVSFCLASVLSICSGWFAQAATPPRVVVSADHQVATVGDPIKLSITVDHQSDWQQFPQPLSGKLGDFDILRDTAYVDRWREGDKGLAFKRELTLAAFKPGGVWIPSVSGFTVIGADTLRWQTDSLAINIESVLGRPDADTTDIAGLKQPYVAPESRWRFWTGIALLVAAIAVYLWYRLRRRTHEPVPVAPPRPAWEIALEELEQLRREVNPAADGGRLWYFRLSEILRRYWDARYDWQSIDQTTTEIIRVLPQAPFAESHRRRAAEFLHLADYIRYARQPAQEGRPEVDWAWVKSFIVETRPPRLADSGASEPSGERAAA
jgi:hypothetical protein